MKPTWDRKVPFNGQQQLLEPFSGEWKENWEWHGKLHVIGLGQHLGTNMLYGSFEDGMQVYVLLEDFSQMLPHLDHGIVEGMFTFGRRGEFYGCRLLVPSR